MNSALLPWIFLFVPAVGILFYILFRAKEKNSVEALLPPFGRVQFDDKEIIHHRENLEQTHLLWQDLTKLRVLTTPDGPFLPDVFWVFESDQRIVLKIPSEAEGMSDLSDRLMKLPEFQSEKMIAAMSSAEYASFEVWRKSTTTPTF